MLQQANETLSLLQHSVDLDVSTATVKASLFEWKNLFVLTFCKRLMFSSRNNRWLE
nr:MULTISPECIES: tail fiber assembly protein [Photorhabdus]